jgi:hypothetical protein
LMSPSCHRQQRMRQAGCYEERTWQRDARERFSTLVLSCNSTGRRAVQCDVVVNTAASSIYVTKRLVELTGADITELISLRHRSLEPSWRHVNPIGEARLLFIKPHIVSDHGRELTTDTSFRWIWQDVIVVEYHATADIISPFNFDMNYVDPRQFGQPPSHLDHEGRLTEECSPAWSVGD